MGVLVAKSTHANYIIEEKYRKKLLDEVKFLISALSCTINDETVHLSRGKFCNILK